MTGPGLVAAALAYVPRTVPLAPRDKRPVLSDWPNWKATAESVAAYWQAHPDANVGVRTGRGLVVLDVDPRAGGHDVLADLEHAHGELPPTVECETGGGGRHLYFRGPRDLRSFDLGAGLEVKAAGRQVVAPPSVHPSTGALYTWAEDRAPGDLPLAPMPAWIGAGRVQASERPQATPAREWAAMVRDGLAEGDRNHGLARLVGHLLARDVDARLVLELAQLVATRCRPPLDTAEVGRIVESIAGREVRKRRKAGRA